MPDLGVYHPQVVHFVVALGLVGLALRLVSLSGRLAWTRPSGAVLLLLAAAASVAAVQSGDDAHGPAERIPSARAAVHEHEELGEKARNVLLAVAFFEVAALFLCKRERLRRGVLVASAVTGIVAAYFVIEAAEHGGDVVYSHAGGVGTRSGDPEDVRRLLVAGLYHQARVARTAGHADEAARLTEELVRQAPGDAGVALLPVESMLDDRQDPQAALAALDHVVAPEGDGRFPLRKGLLASRALAASGQIDAARAALAELAQQFPGNRAVSEAQERLK